MYEFGVKLSKILEKPSQVAVICLLFLLMALVLDGSLWQLYQIDKSKELLLFNIQEENKKISKIKHQLEQLKNPAYIEKQARERLEFLEKGDLLFVFSED